MEYSRCKHRSNKVVVRNNAKNKGLNKLTNGQTNEQTNLQTNIPTNINGFRHLIKYGVIFNFFLNQTPGHLIVG